MELSVLSQARKISKTELEISLPENKKNYYLLQLELGKCAPPSTNFSCKLDDWVEAINYVIETLKKDAEEE